jgi:hypothetical protein
LKEILFRSFQEDKDQDGPQDLGVCYMTPTATNFREEWREGQVAKVCAARLLEREINVFTLALVFLS